MKAKIDRSLCIGVGNCVAFAPSVFQLDKENKATVLDPSSVDEKTLREAAESCPVAAVILEDDAGNQIFP